MHLSDIKIDSITYHYEKVYIIGERRPREYIKGLTVRARYMDIKLEMTIPSSVEKDTWQVKKEIFDNIMNESEEI